MKLSTLLIIIIALVIIATIAEEIIFKAKGGEYEEPTEQDKFYTTLRHLIYIIIALLLIPISIKILLLYGILTM